MQALLSSLVEQAYRLCGQSQAPGRGQSAEEVTEGVLVANLMVDSWSAMKEKIFTASTLRFTLTPSQATYTIGPSGADFTAARPTEILVCNIVQTNVNPEVFVQVALIDEHQYADFAVRGYATSFPTYLYYNKGAQGSLLGTLYFIGYPNSGYDVELFVPSLFNNAMTSATSVRVRSTITAWSSPRLLRPRI